MQILNRDADSKCGSSYVLADWVVIPGITGLDVAVVIPGITGLAVAVVVIGLAGLAMLTRTVHFVGCGEGGRHRAGNNGGPVIGALVDGLRPQGVPEHSSRLHHRGPVYSYKVSGGIWGD